MKTQQPIRREQDEEHRVLKFVPRSSLQRSQQSSASNSLQQPHLQIRHADDFAPFEKERDKPDDFHHRILANAAALALTVALIGVGIWLEIRISDLTKMQDCVLMGRRDCVRIAASPGPS